MVTNPCIDPESSSLDKTVSLRHALLEAALRLAYDNGFDGISLRSVSKNVGKSTTVIFQNFGGRQGLLDAALDHALDSERLRHQALLAELGDFPADPAALAECVAYYVQAADQSIAARFCLEALVRAEMLKDAASRLQRWSEIRSAFWTAISPDSSPAHVTLLSDYTVMEQAFCTALQGEVAYDQLLRATARAACLRGISRPPEAEDPVLSWARTKAFPSPGEEPQQTTPMESFIGVVAQRIASEGIGSINLRRIATEEGVPPSLIIYHYGDFAAFLSTAIWRAMMHELPAYLDLTHPTDEDGRTRWLDGLTSAVTPAAADRTDGFYVRYARILSQVCLLARQRPELVQLVRQLRAIEGMGIHRASLNVWPDEYRLGAAAASAFSIWIKSHALSRIGASVSDDRGAALVTVLRELTCDS